jgi:predicted ArsR family transcriptional regulator
VESPAASLEAIAVLQDPVRRRLYDYVAGQDHEVGRAEAADGAGIQRTLAAFHLDRLADVGLLDVVFRRPAGRGGPGAGRPAKLYRRSAADHAVSLPPRDYLAVAEVLAEVVDALGAEDAAEAAARRRGRLIGDRVRAGLAADDDAASEDAVGGGAGEESGEVRDGGGAAENSRGGRVGGGASEDPGEGRVGGGAGEDPGEGRVGGGAGEDPGEGRVGGGHDGADDGIGPGPGDHAEVMAILAHLGYEPYREGAVVRLRNCPFHTLAADFPPLVCGMNLALIEGILEGRAGSGLAARLDPRPEGCCVALRHL